MSIFTERLTPKDAFIRVTENDRSFDVVYADGLSEARRKSLNTLLNKLTDKKMRVYHHDSVAVTVPRGYDKCECVNLLGLELCKAGFNIEIEDSV